jgi:hypothetical protein
LKTFRVPLTSKPRFRIALDVVADPLILLAYNEVRLKPEDGKD